MVRIQMQISRNRLQLTATGHAGFAAKGEDIVCAAASSLVHTLLLALIQQTGNETMLYYDDPGRPGERHIDCGPSEVDRARVEAIFRTIACGLGALADKYPEYVCFEIEEQKS